MKKQYKLALLTLALLGLIGTITLAILFVSTHNIAILNPKGTIADKQHQLMITATWLMAIIVVPVLVLTFGVAWRYREGNKKATYSPELSGNKWLELIWWIVPFIIITILAVMAWTSSHELDPYKPIASNKKPVKVQVIALQWKWLFIYPEEHVATINYLQVPNNTPIDFTLTSDAPMNSFWIPQLGGQVYAMSGMSTKLHLMASQNGQYPGQSANISGEGFAGMKFTTHVTDQSEYDIWIKRTARSQRKLTPETYAKIAEPSKNDQPAYFAFPPSSDGLYNTVVMKYMPHEGGHQ